MGATERGISMPSLWVSAWFVFTSIIVCWDAGYCFLRPRSMVGGDLSWIWYPYNMVPYGAIDYVYGFPALEANDGFTNAQALMNVIEVILNIEFLYLRHTSPRTIRNAWSETGKRRPRYHPQAPLVGFAASTMTVAKTSLYMLQEYYGGWSMVKHNSTKDLIQYYFLPNGVWIVMPTIICIILGKFISRRLMSDTASEIAYQEWLDSNEAENDKRGRSASSLKDLSSPSHIASNGVPAVSTVHAPDVARSGYQTPVTGAALPLAFTPVDLPVLIIGANRLAASRAFAMLEAGAKVTITSTGSLGQAHDEVQYRVKQGQVTFEQKTVKDYAEWVEMIKSGSYTLVCVTDTLIGTVNQRPREAIESIYQACKDLRIPINVSDHPHLSSYSFPSVHRFTRTDGTPSHLQIAISTNGQGCRLSSRLKREIVTRLPSSVGSAVDNVGILRLRARSKSRERTVSEDDPDTPLNNPVEQLDTPSILNGAAKQLGEASVGDEQLRRMRWVHQMSEYYSFDALARMSEREMDQAFKKWGQGDDSAVPLLPQHEGKNGEINQKGRIFLIGSGPGHPGLLTLAAHHVLRSATLILSDKLVPSEILALIPPTTELHIAKKFPGNNEGAQNELMIQALEGARRGETVVRLKQGDPFVYGRGGEEVLYFRENGFESTVIPGVTSVIAGPEMVGIPVTQRGVSESMVLCTGVGRAGKAVSLPGYIKSRTLVVLMGVARIGNIVATLINADSPGRDGHAYPPHLPIAVIERASSPDQRVIVSTLKDIEEAVKSVEERPPGMMLIGWAALALEGKGRVDVLDGADETEIVSQWMADQRWRIREGLEEGWGEYLAGLGA